MTDQQNHPYLFVGGCPRSGTTLLQRMMDHHPQLAVANDTHFIPRALENADSRYYDLALSGVEIPLTEDLVRSVWDYHRFYRLGVDESSFQHIARQCDTFQQLVRELFAWFARQRGKVLSGEKTPDYVRHVPLLRSLFPDSRFVHIVRDGRDVALSLQQWAKVDKGPGRLALWDEDPVSVSALWWRDFVQSPTEQGTHHTPGRLDGRYLLVRYEDLLEDPHAVLTQIVDDFLRLPFSDRMVKFHEGKTANSKSGSAKARWLPATRGLRNWRTQMTPEDVQVFEQLAGDALARYGYELAGTPVSEASRKRVGKAEDWWKSPCRRRSSPQRRQPGRTRVTLDGSRQLVDTIDALSGRNPEPFPCCPPSGPCDTRDMDLIRRDRELASLKWVLETPRFQHLCDDWPSTRDDQPVRASYVRYKPGRSCLVSYVNSSNQPWGFAVAHRGDAREKIAKAEALLQHHPDMGFVDWKRHVTLFRFPLDPRMPQLSQLQEKGHTARWLKNLFPSLSVLDGLEVLSYKPLRRCVFRIPDAQRPAILRIYAEHCARDAAQASKYLGSSPWCQGIRLAASDRHDAVLLRWIPGHVLPIDRWLPSSSDMAAKAGSMLAEIHRQPLAKLSVVSQQELGEKLRVTVAGIVDLAPELNAQLEQLESRILSHVVQSVPRYVLVHGDYHTRQLLEIASGIRAIDWDHARNAPAGLDLGTFVGHLLCESVVHPERCAFDKAQEISESFQASYRERAGRLPDALGAHLAWGLLRVAVSPFRYRHRDWLTALYRIVELAERQLVRSPGQQRVPDVNFETGKAKSRWGKDARPVPKFDPHVSRLGEDEEWLRPVLSETDVRMLLEPALAVGLPQLRHPVVESADVVRHKAGRRAMIQYRVTDAANDSRDSAARRKPQWVLGKVRRKGLDLLAYDVQCRLYDRLLESDVRFFVARPLGVVPEWRMWLQEKIDGVAAEDVILSGPSQPVSRAIGMALGDLHKLSLPISRTHTTVDELNILESHVGRVADTHPQWRNRVSRVLDACRERLDHWRSAATTGIHRDFYPAQVMLSGPSDAPRIGMVDLDLFAWGNPAIDVGNYLAHLRETALREFGNAWALHDHERAFAEGYCEQNPTVSLAAIHDMTAVSLARHIAISHRIETRRGWTEPIVSLCEEILDCSDVIIH